VSSEEGIQQAARWFVPGSRHYSWDKVSRAHAELGLSKLERIRYTSCVVGELGVILWSQLITQK